MDHVGYNKLIEGKVAAVSGAFVWQKSELTVIMFTYNLKRARILSSHPRNLFHSVSFHNPEQVNYLR